MAWWLAFVFQIEVISCCVFSDKKKMGGKKWGKTIKRELDLCIFDCTIKQKDCVFMYVVAIKDRHCLELLSFPHPYLHWRWSVQTVFLYKYIYKSIFKYINFIFHPSCAICCVELSFIVSKSCHKQRNHPFFLLFFDIQRNEEVLSHAS